jgi:hypothetical protein
MLLYSSLQTVRSQTFAIKIVGSYREAPILDSII